MTSGGKENPTCNTFGTRPRHMGETSAPSVEGFLLLKFFWDLKAVHIQLITGECTVPETSLVKSWTRSVMHLLPTTKTSRACSKWHCSAVSESFSS